jgi:hypothetical protein
MEVERNRANAIAFLNRDLVTQVRQGNARFIPGDCTDCGSPACAEKLDSIECAIADLPKSVARVLTAVVYLGRTEGFKHEGVVVRSDGADGSNLADIVHESAKRFLVEEHRRKPLPDDAEAIAALVSNAVQQVLKVESVLGLAKKCAAQRLIPNEGGSDPGEHLKRAFAAIERQNFVQFAYTPGTIASALRIGAGKPFSCVAFLSVPSVYSQEQGNQVAASVDYYARYTKHFRDALKDRDPHMCLVVLGTGGFCPTGPLQSLEDLARQAVPNLVLDPTEVHMLFVANGACRVHLSGPELLGKGQSGHPNVGLAINQTLYADTQRVSS